MPRICIAAVDASRGRLFVYDRSADPEGIHEQMVEHDTLVNLARRERPSDLFSSPPGTGRVGNTMFSMGDRREHHLEHFDADFARTVLARVRELATEHGIRQLILCAGPQMLGHLRAVAFNTLRGDLSVTEVPRELTKLTPGELRTQLAAHHALPEVPPRPTLASR
jgi:protein required for attachment to host cells